jgi:hypothetical protein
MASVVVDDSPSASVGDGVSSAAVESHGELLGNVVVVESSLEKIVDMDVLVLDAAVSVTAVESTTTAAYIRRSGSKTNDDHLAAGDINLSFLAGRGRAAAKVVARGVGDRGSA